MKLRPIYYTFRSVNLAPQHVLDFRVDPTDAGVLNAQGVLHTEALKAFQAAISGLLNPLPSGYTMKVSFAKYTAAANERRQLPMAGATITQLLRAPQPKKPGTADALKDHFYATNHLLEYAVRLIETPPADTIAKNAHREAACVQLRLLGEFLSDEKTREQRIKRREDDQCLTDFFPDENTRPETFPFLPSKSWKGKPGEGLNDLRERLNKTVAHLSLNRGYQKSISDRHLADGIKAIWPAVQNFQKHLREELRSQVTQHITAQNKVWARFHALYPDVTDDVSDSGGKIDETIIV